jgi:hypothetical protein
MVEKSDSKPTVQKKTAIRKGKVIRDLIVCEDIRQESSGKLTLIGVFGDDIVFAEWPEEPVHIQLAFLIKVFVLEGEEIRTTMLAPDKKIIFESTLKPDPKIQPPSTISIILKAGNPVLVPTPGTYKIVVEYGGKRDSRDFSVVIDPNNKYMS